MASAANKAALKAHTTALIQAAFAMDKIDPGAAAAGKDIDPHTMAVSACVWWRVMCGAEPCGVVCGVQELSAALARPSSWMAWVAPVFGIVPHGHGESAAVP